MVILAFLASSTTNTKDVAQGNDISHTDESRIQIALLLDTSNSMDGLIAQAKSQLWKMVNELATAKKGTERPKIELALYHYGNSGLSGENYFIQKLTSFTTDLDLVSEQLFGLRTNGGNEYCGAVIGSSLQELEWSHGMQDLKLILIAGNEPFTQGPIEFKESCRKARKEGIQINTIFCGDFMEGKSSGWEEGARIAEGKYMNIDQDRKITHIRTPYDDRILELNILLNKTYLGYGQRGKEYSKRQQLQDANIQSFSKASAVDRAVVKTKPTYKNSHWDIADAVEEETVDLAEMEVNDLPDELKNLEVAERKKYVDNLIVERKKIQAEIEELAAKAKQFKVENPVENIGTLDEVLIDAVIEQARKKNFKMN